MYCLGILSFIFKKKLKFMRWRSDNFVFNVSSSISSVCSHVVFYYNLICGDRAYKIFDWKFLFDNLFSDKKREIEDGKVIYWKRSQEEHRCWSHAWEFCLDVLASCISLNLLWQSRTSMFCFIMYGCLHAEWEFMLENWGGTVEKKMFL